VMHLGMSGSFHVEDQRLGRLYHASEKSARHDHVLFHLEGGARIIYNDPRRFGFMDLIPRSDLAAHKLFAHIGIEPLGNELDGTRLLGLFTGKSAPLKAALLDQSLIAGLGNIYVCEALFRAKLSPLRAAKSLNFQEADILAPTIRTVLEEAIVAGGSTLNDFQHTDGTLGYFQHRFQVYDREGEPCINCLHRLNVWCSRDARPFIAKTVRNDDQKSDCESKKTTGRPKFDPELTKASC